MREYLIESLNEAIPVNRFIILDSQNVGDIIICREEPNPAIFFLELKLFTLEKGRIGIGNSKGRGFQPEIIKKNPRYFKTKLAWILCDGSQEVPMYYFADTAQISMFLMGDKIDVKQNNIKLSIFDKLQNLSEKELLARIQMFIDS